MCDYPGCTKQFISKGALKIHKSKHLRENGLAAPTDAQCIQCGKIFGSRQVKNSRNLLRYISQFTVYHSGVLFRPNLIEGFDILNPPDRSYLAEHIALVHENKSMKVKCEHCDEILPNRTARTIHTNRVHFPDK